MKALKLYEQLKQLVDEGKITEETEVIAVGEYNYGLDVGSCYTADMAHINGSKTITPPNNTLCLSVGTYLYEPVDVGYSNMWVGTEDYNSSNEHGEVNDED